MKVLHQLSIKYWSVIKDVLYLSYPLWSFWIIYWLVLQITDVSKNSLLEKIIQILWIIHTVASLVPSMVRSFRYPKQGIIIMSAWFALISVFYTGFVIFGLISILLAWISLKINRSDLLLWQEYGIRVVLVIFYLFLIPLSIIITFMGFALSFSGHF
ncbi:MAG: hypothetical protein ACRCXK_06850 [Wohlfahrtiimonas sp.]